MLTILPYLLQGYGRSKCTLLLCPKFGERFKVLANIKEAAELYLETMSKEEIKAYLSREILSTSLEVSVG
jgi:predicted RNase H-like HicB family nuclease